MDIILSGLGLMLLSPVLLLLTLLQIITNGRPVLFRQQRVGRCGLPFTLLKFRTMRVDPRPGPRITAHGDRRITPIGRVMRATKLDELPQLLNVFVGQMSMVGPRPELPDYVSLYTQAQRRVLEARPGLTDPATLRFRGEEHLLASVDPAKREAYYVRELMPAKLALNLAYLERASFGYDVRLILRTVGAIVFPGKP